MTTGAGRVFVLEVMGRNAGWLAAACALAAQDEAAAPQLIVLPERAFDEAAFLARVREVVARVGACSVVVAEGVRGADGLPLRASTFKGYTQLGGAGQLIAERVHTCLGFKVHCAVADYLQRCAGHLASGTDCAQAYAVGEAAVVLALAADGGGVINIERLADSPYRWRTGRVDFADVANFERQLPAEFIRADGFGVTDAFRAWCQPLIEGEESPGYRDGLPDYFQLRLPPMPARLPPYPV
jgi:6-phosphofructokinase 1